MRPQIDGSWGKTSDILLFIITRCEFADILYFLKFEFFQGENYPFMEGRLLFCRLLQLASADSHLFSEWGWRDSASWLSSTRAAWVAP